MYTKEAYLEVIKEQPFNQQLIKWIEKHSDPHEILAVRNRHPEWYKSLARYYLDQAAEITFYIDSNMPIRTFCDDCIIGTGWRYEYAPLTKLVLLSILWYTLKMNRFDDNICNEIYELLCFEFPHESQEFFDMVSTPHLIPSATPSQPQTADAPAEWTAINLWLMDRADVTSDYLDDFSHFSAIMNGYLQQGEKLETILAYLLRYDGKFLNLPRHSKGKSKDRLDQTSIRESMRKAGFPFKKSSYSKVLSGL